MTQRFGFLRRGLVLLLVAWPVAAGAQEQAKSGADKTIIYRSDDPEMKAAIEQARDTLGDFWAMYEAPGPDVGQFSLKVAISDDAQNMTEHFWLGSIEKKDDGALEGTINNVPNHVKSVKMGQRYGFSADQISDWMFYRRGKIVGGYTIRPMLKRLPKERADAIRRMLESP